MQKAINILTARIEKLNIKIDQSQKIADHPEMMCDYEFAINDIGNCKLEIQELSEAIFYLNYIKPK